MLQFTVSPLIATSLVNSNYQVIIAGTVVETVLSRVGATVAWGDGQVTSIGPVLNPLNLNLAHSYTVPGTYVVTVTAVNYASPIPQVLTWSGQAVFAIPGYTPVTDPVATPALIGPIMPRLNGAPSPQAWAWQTGTDNACLISDLTLLLSTNKGERLMDPNFGTNLLQLVFSLSGPIVNDAIFNDVSTAVSLYVPLAQLVEITPTTSGRIVTVSAVFNSLINGNQIAVQNLNLTAA